LPAKDPQFPGLDIAGKSIYCDETGGDYFDFLDNAAVDENK
jgi:sigma-B regulation protein RsbU (phosphoserine phosphatase)